MSVYIDDARMAFKRMRMCHMIADTSDELLAMVDKIGVQRKWIQSPGTWKEHFDVCLTKRELAIKSGAILITQRELALKRQTKKPMSTPTTPPTPRTDALWKEFWQQFGDCPDTIRIFFDMKYRTLERELTEALASINVWKTIDKQAAQKLVTLQSSVKELEQQMSDKAIGQTVTDACKDMIALSVVEDLRNQLTLATAQMAVMSEALKKSKQAIAWSHPYGGNSCAGEVTFDQSAQWIEEAGEAIDVALPTTPQAALDLLEREKRMNSALHEAIQWMAHNPGEGVHFIVQKCSKALQPTTKKSV